MDPEVKMKINLDLKKSCIFLSISTYSFPQNTHRVNGGAFNSSNSCLSAKGQQAH